MHSHARTAVAILEIENASAGLANRIQIHVFMYVSSCMCLLMQILFVPSQPRVIASFCRYITNAAPLSWQQICHFAKSVSDVAALSDAVNLPQITSPTIHRHFPASSKMFVIATGNSLILRPLRRRLHSRTVADLDFRVRHSGSLINATVRQDRAPTNNLASSHNSASSLLKSLLFVSGGLSSS